MLFNDVERCCLPWDWCETKFVQNKNNSIVVFSPNNDTIHAVRANYQHLHGQRTQIYGNFWYKKKLTLKTIEWENLDLSRNRSSVKKQSSIKDFIPASIKQLFKEKILRADSKNYTKLDTQSKFSKE